MAKCILCGNDESTIIHKDYGKIRWYICIYCGEFLITDTAEGKVIRDKVRMNLLSNRAKQCRENGLYLKIWSELGKLVSCALTAEKFEKETANT
ncbi:TPA: hypothetical protein RQO47_003947 [Klebsiella michiganensis]|nr:hypothetical protein [Klebsiella michiganensis]